LGSYALYHARRRSIPVQKKYGDDTMKKTAVRQPIGAAQKQDGPDGGWATFIRAGGLRFERFIHSLALRAGLRLTLAS
jgi:hypothetical protein